jgi:hypothetical protein
MKKTAISLDLVMSERIGGFIFRTEEKTTSPYGDLHTEPEISKLFLSRPVVIVPYKRNILHHKASSISFITAFSLVLETQTLH